jgi:hypothetical protein
MTKLIGMTLLLVGLAGGAMARDLLVPEIDSASAVGALALLSGALLVVRSRHKK